MKQLHFVIRSSGEVTQEQLYLYLENSQKLSRNDISIISEAPFWKALETCAQLPVIHPSEYYVVIDADVLLCSYSLDFINKYLLSLSNPNIGGGQLSVLDFLFGGPRSGGIHIYKHCLLAESQHHISAIKSALRPETELKKLSLSSLGMKWIFDNHIVGLHDYGQSHFDYFRKGYFFAQKHKKLYSHFASYWSNNAGIDNGFKSALFGLIEGSCREPAAEVTSNDIQVKDRWKLYSEIFEQQIPREIPVDNIIKNWLPSLSYSVNYYRKIVHGRVPRMAISWPYYLMNLVASL